MSAPEVKVHWATVSLDAILAEFAKQYEFKDGEKLINHEAFVDTAKGKVVFKLITTKEG